jgi:hypothetical protein
LGLFKTKKIRSASGKIQHLANLVSIWQNSASGKTGQHLAKFSIWQKFWGFLSRKKSVQHLAKFSIWQIWSASGKIQHLANLVSIWQK